MPSLLPILLVLLAVFTASCIIYIAWDLSSERPDADESADEKDSDQAAS